MFPEGIRSGGSFKVRRFCFAARIVRINSNHRETGVHPVNEYELLRAMPAHEENGDEVFSE